MQTVDFRYQGYFRGLCTYHRLPPEKQAKLVITMFSGISSQTADLAVRARIAAFISKERIKFDAKESNNG